MSFFHKVYDLTPLLDEDHGEFRATSYALCTALRLRATVQQPTDSRTLHP